MLSNCRAGQVEFVLRERALLTMKLIDALDAQVTTHAFLRSLFWLATAF